MHDTNIFVSKDIICVLNCFTVLKQFGINIRACQIFQIYLVFKF